MRQVCIATLMALALVCTAEAQESEHYADNIELQVEQDPITDATKYLVLAIDEDRKSMFGVNCSSASDGYVAIGYSGFSLDDSHRLMLRWGDQEPSMERWDLEQDGSTTLYTNRNLSVAQEWAQNMHRHDRLAVRTEEGDTFVYPLNGASEALAEVPCFS